MEIIADVCAALDFSPPARHHAPRHQAGQHDAQPGRRGQGDGLRHRPRGRRRAGDVTPTAAVIGTAQYLSPEQARGEAVDARSDVYATGCVLYELLCGAPPFTGDSPVAMAYQHVREAPRPPRETKPRVAPEMDAIVLKALNKNPLNRYQTAAEMRSDLVRVRSASSSARRPRRRSRTRRSTARSSPRTRRAGRRFPPAAPSRSSSARSRSRRRTARPPRRRRPPAARRNRPRPPSQFQT